MLTGLDRVVKDQNLASQWGRFALVTHGTTVDHRGRSCVQACIEMFGQDGLRAVFGPQHGYWQCEPYNMFETPDGELPINGLCTIPLFSLYGDTREPTDRQLSGLDTLIVDLPDIGCRVYTYMTTLAACMRAAARKGLRVVVLDRPNPLGLSMSPDDHLSPVRVSGNLMDLSLKSFVGWFRVPLVHGLTLGELGYLFANQENINCHYEVIQVEGLKRATTHSALRDMSPRMASPNMPGPWTIDFFPVSVCLEGTNISEGRGTTSPFQAIGAPFLSELRLFDALKESFDRLGIEKRPIFRPHRFRPRFDKYTDQDCGGIFFLESLSHDFCHFEAGIALLCACVRAAKFEFKWRDMGYEYNSVDNPIDLILGDRRWRPLLERLRDAEKPDEAIWTGLRGLLSGARLEASNFSETSRRFWVYS